jgi:hypothetical protein
VSGVWVMGETGDPRFLPMLGRLIGEPVAELRGNALAWTLRQVLRGPEGA